MATGVRIFIDFWNFQINWNEKTNKARINWKALPIVLIKRAEKIITPFNPEIVLSLEETRVYVSVNPDNPRDRELTKWLESSLDRLPNYRVFIKKRKRQEQPIRCRKCETEIYSCPSCNEPIIRSSEKGVDTQIATDLLTLAWERAYDVAILISSDADHVPAVERIQEKGLKVINVTWRGYGHSLAKVCWASLLLDDLITSLKKS